MLRHSAVLHALLQSVWRFDGIDSHIELTRCTLHILLDYIQICP